MGVTRHVNQFLSHVNFYPPSMRSFAVIIRMAEHDDNDSMNYFIPTTLVVACRLLGSGGLLTVWFESISIDRPAVLFLPCVFSAQGHLHSATFLRRDDRKTKQMQASRYLFFLYTNQVAAGRFQTSLKLGV